MSKLVRLDDIAEVVRGVTFSREVSVDMPLDGYVPVLRAGNIQEGVLILEDDLVWVPESFVSANQLLRKNDLVMCTSSGSAEVVGKVAPFLSSEWRGSFGAFCAVIRPITDKCDPSYLKHFLQSDGFLRWARQSLGANIKNIRKSEMESFELQLPTLEEQKRIAAILDKADSLRRKRAQAIALADDFLRATFLDMFGDPVTNPKGLIKVRLDSICDVGSSKRVFLEELKESGVPFYRGTEIGQLGDRRGVDPTLFIAEEHYARLKSEAGVPKRGDLLLPSICPDGRIYVVDTEEKFYFKDARVLWIKVNGSNIDSLYLRWFLKLLFASEYSKIASGTTFAELKIFALKQLEVCLPPIDVQRHFAKVVNSTERLLERYEQSSQFHDQLSMSFQHGSLG